MRTALVGGLLGLLLGLPAVSAHGVELDNRPCVSKTEYQSAVGAPIKNMSRPDLEERWEVTGLGVKSTLTFVDLIFWDYPACGGYTLDEKSYGAAFFRDNFPNSRQTGLYAVLSYTASGIPDCHVRACRSGVACWRDPSPGQPQCGYPVRETRLVLVLRQGQSR